MNQIPMIKKFLVLSMEILLLLAILLSFVGPVIAQENDIAMGKTSPNASPGQGPTDPAEMEAFLDDLMGKQLEEHHIAGATVSVVKDGRLFFAKGYGYADLEKGIPVDPVESGFLIGSISKLFTWTAVMQLVEQGKLDLEADINTYLDFQIPDTYPEPITLKHLLTHTPGFEDRYNNYLALESEDLIPTREWLVSNIPARVKPPGDYPAYSNYGTSLAGYIVARVSGQDFDRYIQENILDPLGMGHTFVLNLAQPGPDENAAVGYSFADGAHQEFPRYLGQLAMAPAGGMQSSATDMARFMIAHLQGGRYSDANTPEARILEEATVEQMHSTLYTHDTRLLGTAYGFFEFSDNGQRTIGHSGEAAPYNSLLLLLPDQSLGIFVSYSSEGAGELTNQHLGFQREVFDHYYPVSAVEPVVPSPDFAAQAGRYAGIYRLTRNPYTTLEKVAGLMGTVEISASGEGSLLMTSPWGVWEFIETAPLYFRQVDKPFGIVFEEDERGRITHMFTDYTPMFAFERLQWYETPGFSMALLLICVFLFVSMIIVVLLRALLSRRKNGARSSASHASRAALWVIVAISVLNLLFVIGTMLWGNPRPLFGVSLTYKIVLGLGVVSAILTAGALVYTVLVWKKGFWGITTRAYYTLVTVAAVGFVWFLNNWNLLGWRY